MAELAILDPRVLPRVIQEYDAPEEMMGLNSIVTEESDTQPSWEYDIEVHTRGLLNRYNSPNSEAFIVDQMPVGTMYGGYAYQRVKKKFNPTTLRTLRDLGEGRATSAAGEAKVRRETEDLRMQMLRAQEYAIWQMLQGSWTFTTEANVNYTIDYGVPEMHKVAVTNAWGAADDQPIKDISNIKTMVQRNCGYPIVNAYMNTKTIDRFYELPEVSGGFLTGAESMSKQGQLSDRQKDMFQNERIIPRFMGINWIEYDAGWLGDANVTGGDSTGIVPGQIDPTGGARNYASYIPDNKIIFLVTGGAQSFVIQKGPSLDDSAPPEWTGVYTKTWKEEDPSTRQVLMEEQYMVYMTNPMKVAVLDIK